MKRHLRIVTESNDMPQMDGPEPQQYPESLIKLTDQLIDNGLLEMAHMCLDQWARTERLIRFCSFMIQGDDERTKRNEDAWTDDDPAS